MKTNWRRIGCLACLTGVVVLAVIAIIFAAALRDVIEQEFAPLNAVPAAQTTPQQRATPGETVPELAYIETAAVGYSDDADPQDEGIAIDIQFYDSTSQPISFSGIPFTAKIELYAFTDPLQMLEANQGEIVYSGSLGLDHSMTMGEMFGNYIRVPFDAIAVDPSTHQPFGRVKVIVETPLQGSFDATWEPVQLYEQH